MTSSDVGPADSPWPMFQGGPRNTGRSPYRGAQENKLQWSFEAEYPVSSSPTIGPDGTIYVGSNDSNVYAFNHDGSLKWSYETGGIVKASPAIASDGTIYFGSDDDKIYALNPDGTLEWTYETGDYVKHSPTIGSDGTIYVGSFDDKLYALNPDGSLKWTYQTSIGVGVTPAIGPDGTIYIDESDNRLIAIKPDGSLKWSYTAEGDVDSSPTVASDGTIYFGVSTWDYIEKSDGTWWYHGCDGKVTALNPDGSFKWSYETGNWMYSSPAIGPDGNIYVGSEDDKIYALNQDGSLKWSYETGGWVDSSPAVDSDGTVYIGSNDGKLYALNSDGSLKWTYKTGDMIKSSPAIGSDGRIYVGSNDAKLYAIGRIEQYDLSASSNPVDGGSVILDPPGGTYENGTEVTVTADPASGYEFDNWSGDYPSGHQYDNQFTVTMDSDKSLTAHFSKIEVSPSINIRNHPSAVQEGENFTVMVENIDDYYETAAEIIENVPENFEFLGAVDNSAEVTWDDENNQIEFYTITDDDFGYRLQAPNRRKEYRFVGTLENIEKVPFIVEPTTLWVGRMKPVEYYKSRGPTDQITKQNVVQCIKDYFRDRKIPEIGRGLTKGDVVDVIRAYFS